MDYQGLLILDSLTSVRTGPGEFTTAFPAELIYTQDEYSIGLKEVHLPFDWLNWSADDYFVVYNSRSPSKEHFACLLNKPRDDAVSYINSKLEEWNCGITKIGFDSETERHYIETTDQNKTLLFTKRVADYFGFDVHTEQEGESFTIWGEESYTTYAKGYAKQFPSFLDTLDKTVSSSAHIKGKSRQARSASDDGTTTVSDGPTAKKQPKKGGSGTSGRSKSPGSSRSRSNSPNPPVDVPGGGAGVPDILPEPAVGTVLTSISTSNDSINEAKTAASVISTTVGANSNTINTVSTSTSDKASTAAVANTVTTPKASSTSTTAASTTTSETVSLTDADGKSTTTESATAGSTVTTPVASGASTTEKAAVTAEVVPVALRITQPRRLRTQASKTDTGKSSYYFFSERKRKSVPKNLFIHSDCIKHHLLGSNWTQVLEILPYRRFDQFHFEKPCFYPLYCNRFDRITVKLTDDNGEPIDSSGRILLILEVRRIKL